MQLLIVSLIAGVTAAWGVELATMPSPANAHVLWLARQQALYLSGLLSIALMSLTMLLATRPVWAERPLGGMDRVYRTHKWAGILAVAFAGMHWLIEMSDDILKAVIGRQGRVPKEAFAGFLEAMRHLAKDMGEWTIYVLLAMLAITLWKRIPYRAWRFLHRVMPVLYLMLVFHAALLAPTDYWRQPVGVVLALLLAAGTYGSIRVLAGQIGRTRQADGVVVAVERPAPDLVGVRCRLDRNWRGHRPGQFAFVTFDAGEGAHPFTIASADRGDGIVEFRIKALGDYTARLADRLQVGQAVRIEGPYGCFDLARRDRRRAQVWIAGGIGVTPFLAWLESLQEKPEEAPTAVLHYCTRDGEHDAFVGRLEALCATLPGIRLHVHGAKQGARLDAAVLAAGMAPGRESEMEIWFCGPNGLAGSLREGLQAMGLKARFHQEAFEMR